MADSKSTPPESSLGNSQAEGKNNPQDNPQDNSLDNSQNSPQDNPQAAPATNSPHVAESTEYPNSTDVPDSPQDVAPKASEEKTKESKLSEQPSSDSRGKDNNPTEATTHDYLRSPVKQESSLVWVPQQSSTDFVVPGTKREQRKSPDSNNESDDPSKEESTIQNENTGINSPVETDNTLKGENNLTHDDSLNNNDAGDNASEHTVLDAIGTDGDSVAADKEESETNLHAEHTDSERHTTDENTEGENSGDDVVNENKEAASDDNDNADDDNDDSEEEDEEEDYEEEEEEDGPTTLREHLIDLRRRVFFMFLWAVAGFALCFPFATDIFNHLMDPMIKAMEAAMKLVPTAEGKDVIQLFMEPMVNALTQAVQSGSATQVADAYTYLIHPMMETMIHAVKGFEATHTSATLIYTAPSEAFFTEMKVAFVAGLFVMSPMIFYQVWRFVAPGLYNEEKVILLPLAFASGFFFVAGGAFCYFVAFPTVFKFFMSYNSASITAMPSLKESLSFALQFMVAFGVVFEMPLFTFFLARLGVVTGKMLRSFWRYSIIIILVVAAVLTPPDVISQCLMAGPMLILYGISILIADIFGKKAPVEEEEDEEDEGEEEDEEDNNNTDTVADVEEEEEEEAGNEEPNMQDTGAHKASDSNAKPINESPVDEAREDENCSSESPSDVDNNQPK